MSDNGNVGHICKLICSIARCLINYTQHESNLCYQNAANDQHSKQHISNVSYHLEELIYDRKYNKINFRAHTTNKAVIMLQRMLSVSILSSPVKPNPKQTVIAHKTKACINYDIFQSNNQRNRHKHGRTWALTSPHNMKIPQR
jgi:hypothetical protein